MTAPVAGAVVDVSPCATESVSRLPASRSPQAASAPSAPNAVSTLSAPLGINADHSTLSRRHLLAPTRQRLLLRPLDIRLNLGFHIAQRGARNTFVDQILLVQPDWVSPPPPLEELGGERLARLGFIVRGMPTHAERLGHQQRGPIPPTAALDGEHRQGVRVEHVVAIELAAPHPVRARPLREARRGRRQVMLLETRSERDLIVLDDEDRRHAAYGGEVEPLV